MRTINNLVLKDIAIMINRSDNQQRYHFLVGPQGPKKEVQIYKVDQIEVKDDGLNKNLDSVEFSFI